VHSETLQQKRPYAKRIHLASQEMHQRKDMGMQETGADAGLRIRQRSNGATRFCMGSSLLSLTKNFAGRGYHPVSLTAADSQHHNLTKRPEEAHP